MEMELRATAAKVLSRLREQAGTICTVESCTGGMIADLLTDVPGSSEFFWGSMVAYDDTAKEVLVGVAPSLLKMAGPVSPEVARALAEGGLRKMEAAIRGSGKRPEPKLLVAISTTGIAGPAGGSAEKPVGLCYVGLAVGGLAVTGLETTTMKISAPPRFERQQNKMFFAARALELVLRLPPVTTPLQR